MRITHLKIQGTSQWRWLLVLPAVLIGYLVPGFLIRIAWEVGWSWIPGIDFLMMRVAEFLQHAVDGFCAVFFAGYVAPRRARAVRLVAAIMTVIGLGGFLIYSLLIGYYPGPPTVEVIWQIVLWVTQILAAIAAGLVRYTPPAYAPAADSFDPGGPMGQAYEEYSREVQRHQGGVGHPWWQSRLSKSILITMLTPIISYIGGLAVTIPMQFLFQPPPPTAGIVGAIIFVVSTPFIFFKLGKIVRLWSSWRMFTRAARAFWR